MSSSLALPPQPSINPTTNFSEPSVLNTRACWGRVTQKHNLQLRVPVCAHPCHNTKGAEFNFRSRHCLRRPTVQRFIASKIRVSPPALLPRSQCNCNLICSRAPTVSISQAWALVCELISHTEDEANSPMCEAGNQRSIITTLQILDPSGCLIVSALYLR